MALFTEDLPTLNSFNKKGFTITEVIVSVLIIGVLAAGVFSAFVGAERLLIRSRYRMQAYHFEKEVLDKLRSDRESQWADDNMSEALPHKASDIGVSVSEDLGRLLFNADSDTDFTYAVQGDTAGRYNKTVTVTLKLDWSKLE